MLRHLLECVGRAHHRQFTRADHHGSRSAGPVRDERLRATSFAPGRWMFDLIGTQPLRKAGGHDHRLLRCLLATIEDESLAVRGDVVLAPGLGAGERVLRRDLPKQGYQLRGGVRREGSVRRRPKSFFRNALFKKARTTALTCSEWRTTSENKPLFAQAKIKIAIRFWRSKRNR